MITYEPFWDTLKARGLSTYALIKRYHVSSSLIHRMRHNMPISTVTMDDFCRILDCGVGDIAVYTPDEASDEASND